VKDGTAPEYRLWNAMRQRCYNPNQASYCDYGARGITVCAEWRASFLAFIQDMGMRPSGGMTLERKDNNLGYCKSNCEWADRAKQSVFLTLGGITKTMGQWNKERGFSKDLIRQRLLDGWSVEMAITQPARKFTWRNL
jgi:hypothetical protein